MARAGFKGEVLSCYTTWLCASCYACAVECPKQIKITDVMYAVKRLAIREGVYPKKFPIPALAREFFRSVEKDGRQNEGRLIMSLYMKTNPFKLFKQMSLGMGLLRRGRMSMGKESIKRKDELHKMLKVLEKEYMVKPSKATATTKEAV